MEFTNDIRFNIKPTVDQFLGISYFGKLTKENSSEMYIVYGFGENWDKTTEQKMEKSEDGFSVQIKIENYDTLNFCFRNNNYVWDNNNSFNYISGIAPKVVDSQIEQVSNENNSGIIDNSIDSDLNITTQKIENNDGNDVLDNLIGELFEEYNQTENKISASENNASSSLSNNTLEINETNFDKLFDELSDVPEISGVESYTELSNIFDKIISDIEEQNKLNANLMSASDIGKELDTIFEEIFSKNVATNTVETFIPEQSYDDAFAIQSDKEELNETFSEIVKNISKVEEKTPSKVDSLNYDYSDFNGIFDFAKIEMKNDVFDFSNLEFDFDMNNINTIQENAEQVNVSIKQNNFSDSFYDDADISTHDAYSNFQEIVNNVVNELEKESNKQNVFENEEFKKQNAEFENVISEYTQYFDSLIEEIVSTPTTSLSTPVSTEQVLENENTNLAIGENQDIGIANTNVQAIDTSTDSVPNEYALFDYKSHSFMYMIKRRFKLIVNTLFTKLPKLFGKENSDNL